MVGQRLRGLDASGHRSAGLDNCVPVNSKRRGDGCRERVTGVSRGGGERVFQLHGQEGSGRQDARVRCGPKRHAGGQLRVRRDGWMGAITGRGLISG